MPSAELSCQLPSETPAAVSTSASLRMPFTGSQMNASSPAAVRLMPTITQPSADTACASLRKTPPGRSPRPTMPFTASQRNASPPSADAPVPTTTEPFAETPSAVLEKLPPGRSPRPTMPFTASQRIAWRPSAPELRPTTTFPSADRPNASLNNVPPGRSPRPCMPRPACQRKASLFAVRPVPATVMPSAETPRARLEKLPPGRSPRPASAPSQRNASSPGADCPRPTTTSPSSDTANASLVTAPPARSPRPTMPFAASQRKASTFTTERPVPTTTFPSAETSFARLRKGPPGRSPRPWKEAGSACEACATSVAMTAGITKRGDMRGTSKLGPLPSPRGLHRSLRAGPFASAPRAQGRCADAQAPRGSRAALLRRLAPPQAPQERPRLAPAAPLGRGAGQEDLVVAAAARPRAEPGLLIDLDHLDPLRHREGARQRARQRALREGGEDRRSEE